MCSHNNGGEDPGVNLQVIEHRSLSDALSRTRDNIDSYAQSPLWGRSDDVDSMGDNDFGQHKSAQEPEFEDTVVTHYENYDTIGIHHSPSYFHFTRTNNYYTSIQIVIIL